MSLQPVARRSVPEDVFEQILENVTSGQYAAGDRLPSERALAEVLQVSRPAVRESLKRLSAAGLIDIRQGDATSVRDFRRSAGLDLLPRLLMRGGTIDLAVARSVLEARLHNGPKVAALAAERGGSTVAAALTECVRRLEAETDPVALQRVALDYWDCVVDGADSIAFRLMFNTLRAAYEPALDALAAVMLGEVGQTDAYRTLAEAIGAGVPADAQAAAYALLAPATTALISALTHLEAK